MPDKPKPDLSEHEEEAIPFDEVLRRLLKAKPSPAKRTEKRSSDDDEKDSDK